MSKNRLSVIIPVYNEIKTIQQVIDRVLRASVNAYEVIVVDDGSNDGTRELLKNQTWDPRVRTFFHTKNMGKGNAIITGIKETRGEIVVIQDADLEYDPEDLIKLKLILDNDQADVVFGSRFITNADGKSVLRFWHTLGNKIITLIFNMVYNVYLTDVETCYKMIRVDFLKKITLKEGRFGIEPEMAAKLLQINARFWECPISYKSRSYKEGKKIGIKDLFRALYCIAKYKINYIINSE